MNLVRVTDLFNVLFNSVCKCVKSFLLKQIGKYSIVTKIGECGRDGLQGYKKDILEIM